MAQYDVRYRFLTCWRSAVALLMLAVSTAHAAAMAAPGAASPEAAGAPADLVSGLIVKFDSARNAPAFAPAARAEALSRALDTFDAKVRFARPLATGAEVHRLDEPVPLADAEAMARTLSRVPGVLYAAPNRVIRPQVEPQDPLFADVGQWGFKYSPGSIEGANFTSAWDITRGLPTQTIGIIDSGIARANPELTNQLRYSAGFPFGGYDFMSDAANAGDGDGRDPNPEQFHPETCAHGVHVSSTIAARTSFSDDGAGVAGGAPQAKILMARVFRQFGDDADAIDAMLWLSGASVPGVAANPNPTPVINMSFGGFGGCGSAYQDAIDTLLSRGVLPVTAAGNSATDVATFAPANCRGTLQVAASDIGGNRAVFTNVGRSIAIAAPGVNVLSTGETVADLCYKSGTSMAAPHVTAAVALMQAVAPTLSVNQARLAIRAGARPFPAASTCTQTTCGVGLLDAYGAVSAVSGSTASVGFNESSVSVRENDGSVTLTVSRIGNPGGSASVAVLAVSDSATLGVDFLAATPATLSWAPNDMSDRVVTVPILYRPGEQGPRNLQLVLSAPSVGVALVAPTAVDVRITEVDCDGVTPIAFGQVLAGELDAAQPGNYCHGGVRGPEYNTVRYSFSGTAGQQVSINVRSTTSLPGVLDPYVYLLGPNRDILTENDDIKNTILRDSLIDSFTLTTTGTHYIDVTSWSASQEATGSYLVRLSSCGPYFPGASCNVDSDGDDRADASDALRVLRRLFGLAPAAVVSDTGFNTCSARSDGLSVSGFIDAQRSVAGPGGGIALDIDGDGQASALTDGLILLRVALGLSGSAVVTGATAAGAPRTTWAQVQPYLNRACGLNVAP
jgi:serine protease